MGDPHTKATVLSIAANKSDSRLLLSLIGSYLEPALDALFALSVDCDQKIISIPYFIALAKGHLPALQSFLHDLGYNDLWESMFAKVMLLITSERKLLGYKIQYAKIAFAHHKKIFLTNLTESNTSELTLLDCLLMHHLSDARFVLKAFSPAEKTLFFNRCETTPLHRVVKNIELYDVDMSIVEMLFAVAKSQMKAIINKPATFDERFDFFGSSLAVALYIDNLKLVTLLLRNGASLKIPVRLDGHTYPNLIEFARALQNNQKLREDGMARRKSMRLELEAKGEIMPPLENTFSEEGEGEGEGEDEVNMVEFLLDYQTRRENKARQKAERKKRQKIKKHRISQTKTTSKRKPAKKRRQKKRRGRGRRRK